MLCYVCVQIKDPCPLRVPEILPAAHMGLSHQEFVYFEHFVGILRTGCRKKWQCTISCISRLVRAWLLILTEPQAVEP